MKPFVTILGIAQDGGVPHCGCNKQCCKDLWNDGSKKIFPSSIAVVNPISQKKWIIDITPEFKFQYNYLNKFTKKQNIFLDGIFLTHGHMGHFTGLINFEKSIMNTTGIPVYTMPKMRNMLVKNHPWKDLVTNNNISLKKITDNQEIQVDKNITFIPFVVLHRNENTETVGYIIKGPNKVVLYIPDIDRWSSDNKIEQLIRMSDIAFLDGTFFDESEIPFRNINDIPHPLVSRSVVRFKKLDQKQIKKINFIHLNHTNPLLKISGRQKKLINNLGFNIAKQNSIFYI